MTGDISSLNLIRRCCNSLGCSLLLDSKGRRSKSQWYWMHGDWSRRVMHTAPTVVQKWEEEQVEAEELRHYQQSGGG